jgi:NAD(P)H-dependent FMN reductase
LSSSISPAGRRIAFADGRAPEALDDDTASVVAAIARADALVLATPVYRGSLTGALRNVLDHVPVPALRGTPVGIVAMGGSDHHCLGVERHRTRRSTAARARSLRLR